MAERTSAHLSYMQYLQRLTQKRLATDDDLALYRLDQDQVLIQAGDKVFALDREDEHDNLDAQEQKAAQDDHPYWDVQTNTPSHAECPDQVDHRPQQTPVKDQEDRGTCVCFASLAQLEALFKASAPDQPEMVLSEQYANWLFMKSLGKTWCDDGLRTTLAARYLSTHGVCMESLCPYEDRAIVHTHCPAGPRTPARRQARYGIGHYTIIDRLGVFGPSIANPDYLETLLCKGHDVVFGTHVAWGRPDADGVYDVILDAYGNPQRSRGGHAMVLVGYHRLAPLAYFLCKNSWSTGVGNAGYYSLSYDYIRTYAKYGYIVHRVRSDMPPTTR